MKIFYINPGRIEAGLDSVIKGPPLALLSIAAMVPEHEAELFDFKVDKYREKSFRKKLRESDIVAISSMTPQIYHALEVAQMAKEEGAITILGGYHPTLEPDFCAADPNVDFVARGEGEHTFREIVSFIDGNRDNIKKEDILGISYKDESGNVIHNPARPLEKNLDNFPIPNRKLLKGKAYSYLGTKVMLMETSRGCPHRCEFCCIIKMWNDPTEKIVYRTKSLHRIMEELYTIDLEAWDFVFFNDDNFTINVKRTNKILDMLIKSKLSNKVFFSCQSRVDTLNSNPNLAAKMAKAGFRQIFLGIESVHQASLDAMGKKTNTEMIRNAVRMCTEQGISIFGGFIIGYPGETIKMIRQNVDFAISLELDFVQFTPITAFPGTEFFNKMKAAGKITTFDWRHYNLFYSMMDTDQITSRQMYRMAAEAYARYYMSKGYLVNVMLKRALRDPKFSWYLKIALPWLKQFILGGLTMFHSQGISYALSKAAGRTEAADARGKSKAWLMERYLRFKRLLRIAESKQIPLKSPALKPYLKA